MHCAALACTGGDIHPYGVEFSQLYQAPWINDIRTPRIGGLVLEHGFLASDLLCYTAGIVLGLILMSKLRPVMRDVTMMWRIQNQEALQND